MNGTQGVVGVILAALIIVSFIGSATFIVLYRRVSRWRATPLGRHMYWFGVMMTTLTGLAVLSIFFRDYPFRIYIRLGSWAFLAFMVWQRVWLLLKAFQAGPVARRAQAIAEHDEETDRLANEEG